MRYSHADWAREQQAEPACRSAMRYIVLDWPPALPADFLSWWLRHCLKCQARKTLWLTVRWTIISMPLLKPKVADRQSLISDHLAYCDLATDRQQRAYDIVHEHHAVSHVEYRLSLIHI